MTEPPEVVWIPEKKIVEQLRKKQQFQEKLPLALFLPKVDLIVITRPSKDELDNLRLNNDLDSTTQDSKLHILPHEMQHIVIRRLEGRGASEGLDRIIALILIRIQL